jgi:hypothetical protein
MGYTTEFHGHISIEPPLSEQERSYLVKFGETRRMDRAKGPYFVDGSGDFGQGREKDIVDYNKPPACQPGLWCQWQPSEDGARLEWNGSEKFYEADAWMSYIRSHFLVLGAAKILEPQAQFFWQPHRMSGRILAVGEEASGDVWALDVNDQGVFRLDGQWTDAASKKLFGNEDDDDGDYTSADEALAFLVKNLSATTFGAPMRVAEFADPNMESKIQAFRDKIALEEATPTRPSRTPGTTGRV